MNYIGANVIGKTNRLLAAGKGTYVGDIHVAGMCHLGVVRSPHAHARIKRIDMTAASRMPGVLAVITGDEIRAATQPLPTHSPALGEKQTKLYALAIDKVRYVGEPVAAVVAEDRYTADKAVKAVEVEYEELPAVVDPVKALEPGATLVVDEWGDNILSSRVQTHGDPDARMRAAAGTVTGVVKTQRYTGASIEPRGYLAEYDKYRQRLTFWASTQSPHSLRLFLATTLGLRESQVHVIQPHVGGAFGLKLPTFPEEPLICYLAMRLERPIRWIEERMENLAVGGHAREMELTFEAGYEADGRVTALTVRLIADVGAPSALCGWGMANVAAFLIPGVYKINDVRVDRVSVVTNKCPWNAYRAYGKEAACFMLERIMDVVAERTGLDRAEVRLRNFIQPDEFPFKQVSGASLDSGNYQRVLHHALEAGAWKEFGTEQAKAKAAGELIGIGLAYELTPEGGCIPQSSLLSAYDGTRVRLDPTGEVTVMTGVTSPGCGNETGIAQIVADGVGVPIDDVQIVQGDTDICPFGLGNSSSRSVIFGGSAAKLAAQDLREKMCRVASRMLEVAVTDLEVGDGKIAVKGAPARFVTVRQVASAIYSHAFSLPVCDEEPGLDVTRYFRHGNFSAMNKEPDPEGRLNFYSTWPNGATIAVVRVDPDTGMVKVLRLLSVHDAGVLVNPMLVNANLHGAFAQSLGGAMYEQLVYDDAGQLLTGTFMDYTMPTAVDLPSFEIAHEVTPSPFNPLGAKGAGESGISGPMAAVASAIDNALQQIGVNVHVMEMPLTPDRVWRSIQAAREAAGKPA
ncbi:MAG: xanthine dehydrogenase family protein molybdopterin-binding subunit [Candidatus Binatia bacterium]